MREDLRLDGVMEDETVQQGVLNALFMLLKNENWRQYQTCYGVLDGIKKILLMRG